jgi:hypothetical protein
MNSLTNKLIIIAGVILILLIIVTLFISSLTKKAGSSQQPTLIPTGVLNENGGSFGGNIMPTLSEQEKQELEQQTTEINSHLLSSEEFNKLNEIKSKLPVTNNDFDLAYSELLGQFFVQKKSSQADSTLQKYLHDNNFLDVYQKFPELFVNVNKPVNQAIQQAEENLITSQQKSQNNQTKAAERKKTQLEKQQALFFDFIGTLTDFELGTSSGSKNNTTNEGGNLQNTNISGRTVGKTSVPTTGKLTPIQIAAAAVIARYGNYPTASSINWTWVIEATAVGLAESGGYCCGVADNNTSWGVWQDDAVIARMNLPNCVKGKPPTGGNCAALFDPIINAQAMWSIQDREVALSQSRYGTNWGAYWSTGRPGASRFFKKAEFYNPAQQAATQLKNQLQ